MVHVNLTSTALILLISFITTVVQAAPPSHPSPRPCDPFPLFQKTIEGTTTNWGPLTGHYSPLLRDIDYLEFGKNITVPAFTSDGKTIIRGEFLQLILRISNNKINIKTSIKDGHHLAMEKNPPLMIRMIDDREIQSILPEWLMVPIDPKGYGRMECESVTRFPLWDVSQQSVSLSRVINCPHC